MISLSADITVTVWDKDVKSSDAAVRITLTDQKVDVTLSGGGVSKVAGSRIPSFSFTITKG